MISNLIMPAARLNNEWMVGEIVNGDCTLFFNNTLRKCTWSKYCCFHMLLYLICHIHTHTTTHTHKIFNCETVTSNGSKCALPNQKEQCRRAWHHPCELLHFDWWYSVQWFCIVGYFLGDGGGGGKWYYFLLVNDSLAWPCPLKKKKKCLEVDLN